MVDFCKGDNGLHFSASCLLDNVAMEQGWHISIRCSLSAFTDVDFTPWMKWISHLCSSVILYDFQYNCPEQMFQVDGAAVMYSSNGKGRLYAVIANVLWIRTITLLYLQPTAVLVYFQPGKEAWGVFVHCVVLGVVIVRIFGKKKSTIWMINNSFIEHLLSIDFFLSYLCSLYSPSLPCAVTNSYAAGKILPWASECAISYHTQLVLEILILLWES